MFESDRLSRRTSLGLRYILVLHKLNLFIIQPANIVYLPKMTALNVNDLLFEEKQLHTPALTELVEGKAHHHTRHIQP